MSSIGCTKFAQAGSRTSASSPRNAGGVRSDVLFEGRKAFQLNAQATPEPALRAGAIPEARLRAELPRA